MSACTICGRETHGEPCHVCNPQLHDQQKAYMAKERQAIVGWLRHLGADTEPLALLIESGQHWKDQP